MCLRIRRCRFRSHPFPDLNEGLIYIDIIIQLNQVIVDKSFVEIHSNASIKR